MNLQASKHPVYCTLLPLLTSQICIFLFMFWVKIRRYVSITELYITLKWAVTHSLKCNTYTCTYIATVKAHWSPRALWVLEGSDLSILFLLSLTIIASSFRFLPAEGHSLQDFSQKIFKLIVLWNSGLLFYLITIF